MYQYRETTEADRVSAREWLRAAKRNADDADIPRPWHWVYTIVSTAVASRACHDYRLTSEEKYAFFLAERLDRLEAISRLFGVSR